MHLLENGLCSFAVALEWWMERREKISVFLFFFLLLSFTFVTQNMSRTAKKIYTYVWSSWGSLCRSNKRWSWSVCLSLCRGSQKQYKDIKLVQLVFSLRNLSCSTWQFTTNRKTRRNALRQLLSLRVPYKYLCVMWFATIKLDKSTICAMQKAGSHVTESHVTWVHWMITIRIP